MKTVPLSVRLPKDVHTYVSALSNMTGHSLNAVVAGLLLDKLWTDPLTRLRVIHCRGRYVIASAFTDQRYRGFSDKADALSHARTVIKAAGGNPTNVIDETGEMEVA